MSTAGWKPQQPRRRGKQKADDEESSRFVFVDASGVNGLSATATRRLIHQHAMKAIGKSRRRPKADSTVVLDLEPLRSTIRPRTPPTSPWLGLWKWRGGCNSDPFLQYPMELDAAARELIAYVFDDERGHQRPLRDAWFTVGLQDEAAFSQILSNSALHLEVVRKKGKGVRETPESIRYYAMAIASVRRRMENATSETLDGIIGTITGMMAHADIIGNEEEWIMHQNGLQHLIQLRGGIEQLEGNSALRLTVSWCELRGVCLLDQRPKFPLPGQWLPYSTPDRSSGSDLGHIKYVCHLSRIWEEGCLPPSEWCNLYSDLATFSVQSFQGVRKMESGAIMPADFGAWTNPMIHRLLSWRPAEGTATRESMIQETCRLGALLYLVPAWRFFGVAPVISRVLYHKLKASLAEQAVEWSGAWALKLWSLYMGGVEALDSEEEDWYIAQIAATLIENGVGHWHDAIKHIQEILWFECLFDGRDDLLAEKVNAILQ